MISTRDILEEIDRTLRILFPSIEKVHLERIQKLMSPAISLEVISYRAPAVDPRIVRRMVDVEIIYFSKGNSVAEALAVQEALTRAFSIGLKVKDRFIKIDPDEMDARMVDQILHFLIQFDYYDELQPLIATDNGNVAPLDPGSTHIDNITDEKEHNEVTEDKPPVVDLPGQDSPKELVEDLKYMEILKVDYTL